MNRFAYILFFIVFCSSWSFSQTVVLDSLRLAYETEGDDTKYQTFVRYCFYLMHRDSAQTNKLIVEVFEDIESSSLPIEKQYFYKGQLYEVKAILAGNEGDNEGRLNYYKKCLELSQLVKGKDGALLRGIAHWGAGTAFGQQGLFEKSNKELFLAEKAFIASGHKGKQADVFGQIGQNFHQLQQYDSVLVYLDKALLLEGEDADVLDKVYFIFFKANAFNALDQPDSTITLLNLPFLDKIIDARPSLYAHLIMAKADAYSKKKLFEQAENLLKEANLVVNESNDSQLRFNYLYSNMNFEKARNNYEGAYVALENLYAFQDSTYKKVTEDRFMDLQSKYDAQSKDFQISALEQKNTYQKKLLLVGGTLFSLVLLFTILWYRNREAKRLAIQSKNNQQIRISFKYDEPEIEDTFLQDTIQLIDKHMADDDFSVEKLTQLSGLNRSNLNKRLKGLTNKTASKLIREIRLEKARALLMKNDKNISEVAFIVGFKDSNYFSTSFKDYFGFPPSELRKNA